MPTEQQRTDRVRDTGHLLGLHIPFRSELQGYLYEYADLVDLIVEAGDTVPDHIRNAALGITEDK